MKKEFVMRGQTESGQTEILQFGGRQKEMKNMAYRLVEFEIFPSTGIGVANNEMSGSITAGKTAVAPTDPNFNDDGLIATAIFQASSNPAYPNTSISLINDTFLITQDLILMVQEAAAAGTPVNWQCRFEAVKMTDAETATTNFKQYSIFDE